MQVEDEGKSNEGSQEDIDASVLYNSSSDSSDTEADSDNNTEEPDMSKSDSGSESDNKSDDAPKKSKKKGFVFDKDKYIEQGITDESALQAIEDAERRLHQEKVTTGRQGAKNKKLQDELEALQKKGESLKADQKRIEDGDIDEEDLVRKNKEQQAENEREQRVVQNKSILEALGDEEALDISNISDEIAKIISNDMSNVFGRDDEVSTVASTQFKDDPLGYVNPTLLLNLIERARAYSQIETLKSENDELKNKIKEQGSKITKRIQNVSKLAHISNPTPGGNNGSKETFGYEHLYTAQ